jgi:hypothetical protein
MALQSDILNNYRPGNYPQLPGSDPKFFNDQHQQISLVIAQLVQVVKQIDARLVAHGF